MNVNPPVHMHTFIKYYCLFFSSLFSPGQSEISVNSYRAKNKNFRKSLLPASRNNNKPVSVYSTLSPRKKNPSCKISDTRQNNHLVRLVNKKESSFFTYTLLHISLLLYIFLRFFFYFFALAAPARLTIEFFSFSRGNRICTCPATCSTTSKTTFHHHYCTASPTSQESHLLIDLSDLSFLKLSSTAAHNPPLLHFHSPNPKKNRISSMVMPAAPRTTATQIALPAPLASREFQ